jgi:hypothetical protein
LVLFFTITTFREVIWLTKFPSHISLGGITPDTWLVVWVSAIVVVAQTEIWVVFICFVVAMWVLDRPFLASVSIDGFRLCSSVSAAVSLDFRVTNLRIFLFVELCMSLAFTGPF